MSAYSVIPLASSLSDLVTLSQAQHEAIMGLQRGSTEPTVKPSGTMWYNTTAGEIQMFMGLGWNGILVPGVMHVAVDGSVAMEADLPMGGCKLTGLAAGSAAGHSVRYEQTIVVSGSNAFAADQSMGGHRLTNLGAPVDSTDAVRKGYVDSGIASSAKSLFVLEPDIQTSGTDVINDIGFVPRRVLLRIYGSLRIGGDFANNLDLTVEAGFWDNEAGKGFEPSDEWVSQIYNTGPGGIGDFRVRLTRVDGAQKGVKIEFVKESNGARATLIKYGTGGSDPGVCQILAMR
mgnify:CR=1 FL=1